MTLTFDAVNSNTLIDLLPSLPQEATDHTEFRVLKKGAKRARYETVGDVRKAKEEDDFFSLTDEETEVTLVSREGSKVDVLPLEKPKRKESKRKAKKKAAPVANTGFMTLLRKLNAQKDTHTIGDVAKIVLEHFPEKDIKSVKRIAYNLARMTGVKWKSSAQANTGYMNRIDELLFAGERTTRQIGETVSVEFEKPLKSAKQVVRARLKVLRVLGNDVNPPLEDEKSRTVTYLPETEKGDENGDS